MRLCSILLAYQDNEKWRYETLSGINLANLQSWYDKLDKTNLKYLYCGFYESSYWQSMNMTPPITIKSLTGVEDIIYRNFNRKALPPGENNEPRKDS